MPAVSYHHEDVLGALNQALALNQRIKIIHEAIRSRHRFVHRVAVALYDRGTEFVKTFVFSGAGQHPLSHYEALLSETPSLREIVDRRKPRVVNDLDVFNEGRHDHTVVIRNEGYRASYTVPLYSGEFFWGFAFFNSRRRNCFSREVLGELDVYAHLIGAIVAQELQGAGILNAAIRTANQIVHERDPETGGHINRMSRYSAVIARKLAASGKYMFNDEFIERIYLFSPMHDVGKIRVPDQILWKASALDHQEFEVMKSHTTAGLSLINAIIENFGFESFSGMDILRNIAQFHHEKMDGSGYPLGLRGEDIPIEARIVAVADIFDALTSHRKYKHAWSNEEAFGMLVSMAETELDRDCVDALVASRAKVELIQQFYAGD